MDMKTVKGRSFVQNTIGTKDSEGYWMVVVSMEETLVFNDGSTASEKVESSSLDRDFGMAQQIALRASLAELDEITFSRGFDSLIEGRAYQKTLGKSNGGNPNNSNT